MITQDFGPFFAPFDGGGSVSCTAGKKALGGGATVYSPPPLPGPPPPPPALLVSSIIDGSQAGWSGKAWHNNNPTFFVTVSVTCAAVAP